MGRTRRPNGRPLGGGAVRWPLVALAAMVVLVLAGSWWPRGAAGQGVSAGAASECAASVTQVEFGSRPGRDRLLLPAGYQVLAPVTATRCRYAADGALAEVTRLDAARTARLAALLVAPPGGWPADALTAKVIRPLTDAELARAGAPACAVASEADLLVFAYGEGADAAVLVRAAPCGTAGNGVITLRTPPGVAEELARLATVGR